MGSGPNPKSQTKNLTILRSTYSTSYFCYAIADKVNICYNIKYEIGYSYLKQEESYRE